MRKLASLAAFVASLAAGGIYLYPTEMRLLESDPAPSARIHHHTSNEIELLFNKPVDLAAAMVDVSDPNGAKVSDGKPWVEEGVLVQRLKAPTSAGYRSGEYRVRFYVKATDGKKAKGAFSFYNDHEHGAGHKH
jgi:methionine-rich copper-binding protein CopC